MQMQMQMQELDYFLVNINYGQGEIFTYETFTKVFKKESIN